MGKKRPLMELPGDVTGVPTTHKDPNVPNAEEPKGNNYQEKEESHKQRRWHLKERCVCMMTANSYESHEHD